MDENFGQAYIDNCDDWCTRYENAIEEMKEENKMKKTTINRIIKLQKEFAELYWSTPLISLATDYIHIRPEGMEDIAPLDEWTLNINRHDVDYPYEHQIVVKGIQFVAITVNRIELPAENGTIIKEDENSATARV